MDDTKHPDSKKTLLTQILHFNVVGAVNTGVTYVFYAVLITLGINHLVALCLEYILGICISFFLNQRITFRASRAGTGRRFLRMLWSYSVLLAVNIGLLWCLVDYWGFNKLVSQLAALVVVTGLSFTVQKFYVFRKETHRGVPA